MGKRGPDKEFEARLYVVLPESLKARLKRLASKEGETVSKLVRQWIEAGLSKKASVKQADQPDKHGEHTWGYE